MLAKLTTRNQVTIPKSIITTFADVKHFDIEAKNGCIILKPIRINRADEVREKLEEMDINDQDVRDAIEWARK